MGHRSRRVLTSSAVVLLMGSWAAAQAAPSASPAQAAPSTSAAAPGAQDVVVTVGQRRVTLGELQRRIDELPAYQLATFGSTASEIRERYVERVIVPELLQDEEAARLELAQRPAVRDRLRDTLRQALEFRLREEMAQAGGVPDAAVKAYYEANLERFDTPLRLRLSRILVATEGDARAVLAALQGTVTPARWTALARERSSDRATHLREGNLGFVRPDGQTDAPRVRVEPALYAAALKVKDGELVPQPVQEGQAWAVVWRRGSLPRVVRTLEQEGHTLRQLLARQQLEERVTALVATLRQEHLGPVDEALLERLPALPLGEVGAAAAAATASQHAPSGAPAPDPKTGR